MLKRIDELQEKGETFSIETTLATKSYINLVRCAQANGYMISRRYVAGICNLFNLFMKEVDSWVIFDNSDNHRKQIASGGRHADTIIDEEVLYLKMQRYVK